MKISPEMYIATIYKRPNFGSHPDLDLGVRNFWRTLQQCEIELLLFVLF